MRETPFASGPRHWCQLLTMDWAVRSAAFATQSANANAKVVKGLKFQVPDSRVHHPEGQRLSGFLDITLPPGNGIYTSRDDHLSTLAPLSPSRTQVELALEMGRGAGGEFRTRL